MSKFDNGGPAFAGMHYQKDTRIPAGDKTITVYHQGASLWDFYAAHAMTGMLSRKVNSFGDMAEAAGNAADVMIAEKRKREKQNG